METSCRAEFQDAFDTFLDAAKAIIQIVQSHFFK